MNTEKQIVHNKLEFFDSDQLSEWIKNSEFLHDQMSCGEFSAELSQLELDDYTVDKGRYNLNLRAAGVFPKDKAVIGFVLGEKSHSIVNGEYIEYGTAFIAKEGIVVDAPKVNELEWFIVQADPSKLEAFEIDLPERNIETVPLPKAITSIIASTVNVSFSTDKTFIDIGEGQVVCEEILSALGKRLTEHENSATSVNLSRQIKIVKKAEEFMRHHLQNPIKVSEICRMTNTSERVLEYAFKKIYGISPKRFLTVLRLNKARSLLLNTNAYEVNVTNIAISCGFRHMGRFSAEYKKMFEELPSQTLKPN